MDARLAEYPAARSRGPKSSNPLMFRTAPKRRIHAAAQLMPPLFVCAIEYPPGWGTFVPSTPGHAAWVCESGTVRRDVVDAFPIRAPPKRPKAEPRARKACQSTRGELIDPDVVRLAARPDLQRHAKAVRGYAGPPDERNCGAERAALAHQINRVETRTRRRSRDVGKCAIRSGTEA